MYSVDLQEWHAAQDERLRRREIWRSAVVLGLLSIGLSAATVAMGTTVHDELALLLQVG